MPRLVGENTEYRTEIEFCKYLVWSRTMKKVKKRRQGPNSTRIKKWLFSIMEIKDFALLIFKISNLLPVGKIEVSLLRTQ